MSCPCDKFIYPPALAIPAGLTSLPRQIVSFPELRRAMLAAIHRPGALSDWRGRGEDDLGIMLLEMAAYVGDVLAFYDEVIANEAYLRTARRRPSVRRLTELLGYRPRPAVAAAVQLALLAEGRQPVMIPVGTAFRSGAFGKEPPQVFESGADMTVSALLNRWQVAPGLTSSEPVSGAALLVAVGSARPKENDVILAYTPADGATYAGRVMSVGGETTESGKRLATLQLNPAIESPGVPVGAKVAKALQAASLWSMVKQVIADPDPVESGPDQTTLLTLDGSYHQIKPGQFVVVQKAVDDYQAFAVTQTAEYMMTSVAASVTSVTVGGRPVDVPCPPILVPVTRVTVEGVVASGDIGKVVIHHGFADAGTVTARLATRITSTTGLMLAQPLEEPEGTWNITNFLLEDRNAKGHAATGVVDMAAASLSLDTPAGGSPDLVVPVTVYANVINATRGESVVNEVLGSGDSAIANQSFKLKKKPLTYLARPTSDNESGVATTLEVHVDRIRWKEVPTFFGVQPDEQVYVVRQDDDGESYVTFGDGVRGARLPTGTGNVIATYRYGAGEASPPAGSITQLAKPVKGIQSVKNPVAALGGADAEAANAIRDCAPGSALILGRAISLPDMEAVAARVAGVHAVHVEWAWDGGQQKPVVLVSYIGEPAIGETIVRTLRSLSDPLVPVTAVPATPVPAWLTLQIDTDPRFWEEDVVAAVRSALVADKTGLLSPERIGIGQPLYRSRIFETVHGVPGVTAVKRFIWSPESVDAGIEGEPDSLACCAMFPGSGSYFDLQNGGVVVTTKAAVPPRKR